MYVSKKYMPVLEEYASYIKTIFQHDDSILKPENEPLPATTIIESEETVPILDNEEVVSTASKLGEDNIVDEPSIEQTL